MQIDVLPAIPDQQPILANLLELYSHDFSEFVEVKLGADGRFGYPRLPLYWREAHRHPFLIRADGELAGLVLVQQGSQISSRLKACLKSQPAKVNTCSRLGLRPECPSKRLQSV